MGQREREWIGNRTILEKIILRRGIIRKKPSLINPCTSVFDSRVNKVSPFPALATSVEFSPSLRGKLPNRTCRDPLTILVRSSFVGGDQRGEDQRGHPHPFSTLIIRHFASIPGRKLLWKLPRDLAVISSAAL